MSKQGTKDGSQDGQEGSRSDRPSAAGDYQLKGSYFQQVVIIILIVGVGVLFGMGQNLEMFQAYQSPYGDTQRYITITRRLQEIINPVVTHPYMRISYIPDRDPMAVFIEGLRFGGLPFLVPIEHRAREERQVIEYYKRRLDKARLAAKDGLMPEGEVLDRIYADFLSRPQLDRNGEPTGQTYGEAIASYNDSAQEVNEREVKRYLQVRYAVDALELRHQRRVPVPPAPITPYLARLQASSLIVDRIVLSTTTLIENEPAYLAEAEADEDAITKLYQDHRDDLFTIPESRTLTLLVANGEKIGRHVNVSDADIEAYYEEHKESFAEWEEREVPIEEDEAENTEEDDTEPTAEDGNGDVDDNDDGDGEATEEDGEADGEGNEDEEEPPTRTERVKVYEPLEQVKPDIRSRLETERGTDIANRLMRRLDRAIEEAGYLRTPPEDFQAILDLAADTVITPDEEEVLQQPVGITMVPDVTVEPAKEGFIELAEGYGSLAKKDIDLFAKEAGWFCSPHYTPPDHEHLPMVIQVTAKHEARAVPLAEVRDLLVRYLAARKAWPDLVAKAEEIQTAIGNDGLLSDYFSGEEVSAFWKAEVESEVTVRDQMQTIGAPQPDRPGRPAPTQKPLLAYARTDGPSRVLATPVVSPRDAKPDLDQDDHPRLRLLQIVDRKEPELDEQQAARAAGFYGQAVAGYLGQQFEAEVNRRLTTDQE